MHLFDLLDKALVTISSVLVLSVFSFCLCSALCLPIGRLCGLHYARAKQLAAHKNSPLNTMSAWGASGAWASQVRHPALRETPVPTPTPPPTHGKAPFPPSSRLRRRRGGPGARPCDLAQRDRKNSSPGTRPGSETIVPGFPTHATASGERDRGRNTRASRSAPSFGHSVE